jgi:RecG-like helicase
MNDNVSIDIPKAKAEIKQLGFDNLHELLFYLPLKYFDFTKTVNRVRDGLSHDDAIFFRARTTKPPKVEYASREKKVPSVTVYATDGYENFVINVFGNIWDWKDITVGQDFFALGKAKLWNDLVTIKSAKFVPSHKTNGIVPQYKAKKVTFEDNSYELDSDKIHYYLGHIFESSVGKASLDLCNYIGAIESDFINKLPAEIKSIRELFRIIHFPKTNKEIRMANDAIVALHALKIILDASNSREIVHSPGSIIDLKVENIKELLTYPEFDLNIEQKRAIWDVMKKLSSPYPCDHLISGDVGCGKTIVYAIIAVAAQMIGKHVVIMIPNLPLASQVKNEIEETFKFSDVQFIQKGSKVSFDSKKRNPILIGTSALIHWLKKQENYKPDIFIIDEQQKTGTSQKDVFLHDNLNIIEATATALPRTLMLSLLGMKSVSKIENPPIEKNITSKICYADERKDIFSSVKDVIESGSQVCFLYPLREQSNEMVIRINSIGLSWDKLSKFYGHKLFKKFELVFESKKEFVTIARIKKDEKSLSSLPIESIVVKRDEGLIEELYVFFEQNGVRAITKDSVTDVATAYEEWNKHYQGQVVMLHGGLSGEEKIEAIRQAKSGEKKIIIASSIIEVGITIPELRLLVVVNPNQMGISTLHQIRGRLARLGGEGLFIMLLKEYRQDVDESSLVRLKAIEKYKKGSELAQQDMLQRGFGDLSSIGTNQSGHLKSIFSGLRLFPEDVFNYIKKLL